jgi:hypothetical protein
MLRGDGQPWLFVMIATQIAASPDSVHALLKYTAYGESPPKPIPALPAMRQWIAMYRCHRVMQNSLAAGFGLAADIEATEVSDDLRSVSRMSSEEIEKEISELPAEEQTDMIRPLIGIPFPPDDVTLRLLLDEIDADKEPGDIEEERLFDELITSAAGQYFFRVWWPSLVLYREYAPNLLRSARLGNLDALDRLLRLDKYILHDPGVARVFVEVMSCGRPCDKTRIANATKGRPTVKLTEANIRAGLGALISQFAHLFHSKVTAPEIQALFDGIERIRSGNQVDTKIEATGDAWSKAIQRAKTWPSLPTSPPGQ